MGVCQNKQSESLAGSLKLNSQSFLKDVSRQGIFSLPFTEIASVGSLEQVPHMVQNVQRIFFTSELLTDERKQELPPLFYYG